MTGVLVLGAGGHAKVVADVAELTGHQVVAFVDELGGTAGSAIHGLPVVADLDERPGVPIALGIGGNDARLRRYEQVTAAGRSVLSLVHPSAVVASTVSIGAGTVLMAGVVVNADTSIGEAAVLNTGCSVDHDCRLDDGAHVAPGSRLAGGVVVGRGALVGIGSSVVPGRRIGAWAICGAGSVVVDDVADGVTVKGVPAR